MSFLCLLSASESLSALAFPQFCPTPALTTTLNKLFYFFGMKKSPKIINVLKEFPYPDK